MPTTVPDLDESLTCAIPGCGKPLHLQWTQSEALTVGQLAHPQAVAGGIWPETSSWEVACEGGHVLLVPGPALCCEELGEGCGHNKADFDWSDDVRVFSVHDHRRLAALLTTLRALHAGPASTTA